MRRSIIGAALASAFIAAVAAQAQQPAQPSQRPAAAPAAQAATTLSGCLYREDQVPGRKPNVVERAGVLEDYILADASARGPQGLTGTTPASGNMYKVEGPSDERLKALVGKRVEVTGKIDPEGGPGAAPGRPREDRGLGPDQINLPEFEATAIREISGTCPATPAARK
jgi:hypothetical protein